MSRRITTTIVAAPAVAALGAPAVANVAVPSVVPAVAGALPTWLNPGPDTRYGHQSRSADTASGQRSTAEKSAVNIWSNDDASYYRTC